LRGLFWGEFDEEVQREFEGRHFAADAVAFIGQLNIFIHFPAVAGKKSDGIFYIKYGYTYPLSNDI
jgi:hypothetical protein